MTELRLPKELAGISETHVETGFDSRKGQQVAFFRDIEMVQQGIGPSAKLDYVVWAFSRTAAQLEQRIAYLQHVNVPHQQRAFQIFNYAYTALTGRDRSLPIAPAPTLYNVQVGPVPAHHSVQLDILFILPHKGETIDEAKQHRINGIAATVGGVLTQQQNVNGPVKAGQTEPKTYLYNFISVPATDHDVTQKTARRRLLAWARRNDCYVHVHNFAFGPQGNLSFVIDAGRPAGLNLPAIFQSTATKPQTAYSSILGPDPLQPASGLTTDKPTPSFSISHIPPQAAFDLAQIATFAHYTFLNDYSTDAKLQIVSPAKQDKATTAIIPVEKTSNNVVPLFPTRKDAGRTTLGTFGQSITASSAGDSGICTRSSGNLSVSTGNFSPTPL